MKGALTHQISVQGELTSQLLASVIHSRHDFSYLEDFASLQFCSLAVSCKNLFTGGFCCWYCCFRSFSAPLTYFASCRASTKSICIALTGATLQYLFGTLSSEMFWSCASWGCTHHCHFLLVLSFYLSSWSDPSKGRGDFFYKQNQHRVPSWSNTTTQEVAITLELLFPILVCCRQHCLLTDSEKPWLYHNFSRPMAMFFEQQSFTFCFQRRREAWKKIEFWPRWNQS